MSRFKLQIIIVLVLTCLTLSSYAQTEPSVAAAPPYAQTQLDQLLAPIALYPDPLLSQVLMASTYPLEVVEASRWLQSSGNASLQGDQLATALEQEPWDPSVKSLVSVPQVLHMMDANLQWTEELGNAFLSQQDPVMDSVQRLRQEAQAAGTLNSTPQQTVSSDGSDITIEPDSPDMLYVPTYNPDVVYGAWPYPGYPPYYFPGYAYGSALGFGVGVALVADLWGWNSWDWRNHRIDIDDYRFSQLNRGRPPVAAGYFVHDPSHRQGVPYRGTATRTRFQNNVSPEAQRSFRGYASAPVTPRYSRVTTPTPHPVNAAPIQERAAVARPQSMPMVRSYSAPQARPATPMLESFSRGADVRAQSMRGSESRAAPVARSMSVPRTFSAPRSSGGSGNSRDHR